MSNLKKVLCFGLGLAGLSATPVAWGHTVSLGSSTVSITGADVIYRMTLPTKLLLATQGLTPPLDQSGNGKLEEAELVQGAERLGAWATGGLKLSQEAGVCAGKLAAPPQLLAISEMVELRLEFHCPEALIELTLEPTLLLGTEEDFTHLVRLNSPTVSRETAVTQDRPRVNVSLVEQGAWATFLEYFQLGLHHIWTGYDHILFVISLLLAAATLKEVFQVVTAFTVAHSVTLILATLGIVSIPGKIIEPAIALSIAYVALENILQRPKRWRWALTFAFGLIHGFGFAGVLQEVELPRAAFAGALVSFNVGVEIGQLTVVAALFPALVWLRKRDWSVSATRYASAAILLMGVFWFVERIIT